MAVRPRILILHRTSGHIILGDRIRVERILHELRNNRFNVFDAKSPSITKEYIFKIRGLRDLLFTMFPIRGLKLRICSYKDVLEYLGLTMSVNYLEKIVKRFKPHVVLAETSLMGWGATQVCRKFNIPCIVDIHGLRFAEYKGKGFENWQYIKNIEKEVFETSDYLLVVSRSMRDYVVKNFRISSRKVIVVPNGSEVQNSTANYSFPLNVIYAGAFSYWEKVHDFLDIAKQIDKNGFRFYMAGHGPLKKQLLKRIETEKIPVTYMGYIPKQNMADVLSKMQVGVAPSTKDLTRLVASPIKVFDYMSAGLPVLTSKVGYWGDLVDEEDCGIALDEDDIESYVKALYLLSSKDVWIRKSRNALKVIKEKYSWKKVLQPLINLILTFG